VPTDSSSPEFVQALSICHPERSRSPRDDEVEVSMHSRHNSIRDAK